MQKHKSYFSVIHSLFFEIKVAYRRKKTYKFKQRLHFKTELNKPQKRNIFKLVHQFW